MKLKLTLLLVIGLFILQTNSFAKDPNFYIFLCFGQSNMEGNARIQPEDTINVSERFKVLQAVNCDDAQRTAGNWYTAVPPLSRCRTGLTPADYFGRTLVENLPENITVGVINVSVAGCKIELFDKNNFKSYAETAPSWMTNIINEYGGDPYAHLVEMAKIAQKEGVIKGILLHQGESNTNDTEWPNKVKGVYDSLLKDLKLKSKKVPLLVGELVNADQGGACASMNTIIAKVPEVIPNSYVVSSAGCACARDHIHFAAEGYRLFGKRYAATMLPLLGYEAPKID